MEASEVANILFDHNLISFHQMTRIKKGLDVSIRGLNTTKEKYYEIAERLGRKNASIHK